MSSTITRKRPQVAPDAIIAFQKEKEKILKNDRKNIKETILSINKDAVFFIRYCKKGKTTVERFSLTYYSRNHPITSSKEEVLKDIKEALKHIKLSIPLVYNLWQPKQVKN